MGTLGTIRLPLESPLSPWELPTRAETAEESHRKDGEIRKTE